MANKAPKYKLHARLTGRHSKAISAVRFSPDGHHLASTGADGLVVIWTAEGAYVRSMRNRESTDEEENGMSDVAWTPDSKYLIGASDNKTLVVWDAETGTQAHVLRGHVRIVFCVAADPHPTLIASGSFDGNIFLWSRKYWACVKGLVGHTDQVMAVDFNPRNNKELLSCSHDGEVRIWDIEESKCTWWFKPGQEQISYVRFAPNGRFILCAGYNNEIKMVSTDRKVQAGKVYRTYKGHANSRFSINTCFVLKPGDKEAEKYVVTGSEDGKVYLYNLHTKEVVQTLRGHGSGSTVIGCSPHPQGRLLASAAITETDHTIILWSRGDRQTGTHTDTQPLQARSSSSAKALHGVRFPGYQ
jgi:COMPASS component SWD3